MKLVFIHGSGGGSVVWDHQLAFFPEAEAINLPGHPDGAACDSIASYASTVADYLDSLNEKVVLVGHSLGSAVVMEVAMSSHPLLAGIVLIGAGARLKVSPFLLDFLRKAELEGDGSIPAVISSLHQSIASPLREKINECLANNGVTTLLRDLQACDQFDVMDKVSSLSLPALIVVGEKDQMTPPKYSYYLAEQMHNASIEVVSGGSHMVFAEQPDYVNTLLKDFMASYDLV